MNIIFEQAGGQRRRPDFMIYLCDVSLQEGLPRNEDKADARITALPAFNTPER